MQCGHNSPVLTFPCLCGSLCVTGSSFIFGYRIAPTSLSSPQLFPSYPSSSSMLPYTPFIVEVPLLVPLHNSCIRSTAQLERESSKRSFIYPLSCFHVWQHERLGQSFSEKDAGTGASRGVSALEKHTWQRLWKLWVCWRDCRRVQKWLQILDELGGIRQVGRWGVSGWEEISDCQRTIHYFSLSQGTANCS